MKKRSLIYLAVTAGIFLEEFAVKQYVEEHFTCDTCKPALNNRILLRKYHNEGACLNLGGKRRPLVAVLSLLLTLCTAALFAVSLGQRGNGLLRTGLSVLLGGAFSNTYDRLKRKYVVDYFSLQVKWEPLRNIVFNLADFAILIGALLAAFAYSGQ